MNVKLPQKAFDEINTNFFIGLWNEIREAPHEKTKLNTYFRIYNSNYNMPGQSLSQKCNNTTFQNILTSYILYSHDLECEKGKWSRTPKGERYCKQCKDDVEEDLHHFLFKCTYFENIRKDYATFPQHESISSFFNWEHSEVVLSKLHYKRKGSNG